MKTFRPLTVCLACLGMLLGQWTYAAQPNAGGVRLARDVALGEGSVLRGEVLDKQGVAQSGVAVLAIQQEQVVQRTHTDRDGRFVLTGLRGGVYQIETPVGGDVYRLWSPRTAPPSAADGALIVAGEPVVRGQFGTSWWGNFFNNPWTWGIGIAAAVAIPVALDDPFGS